MKTLIAFFAFFVSLTSQASGLIVDLKAGDALTIEGAKAQPKCYLVYAPDQLGITQREVMNQISELPSQYMIVSNPSVFSVNKDSSIVSFKLKAVKLPQGTIKRLECDVKEASRVVESWTGDYLNQVFGTKVTVSELAQPIRSIASEPNVRMH